MGFSMICEAVLRMHLPEADWQVLVNKFGYSVGFLIVILGRQRLFTKNTFTVILPLLKKRRASILGNVARLWTIVLLANLARFFFPAWLLGDTSIIDPKLQATLATLGREAMQNSFGTTLSRAILAGWFIALMVWLLPFAETARIGVIIILELTLSAWLTCRTSSQAAVKSSFWSRRAEFRLGRRLPRSSSPH